MLKKHYMDYLASNLPRTYYNPYDGDENIAMVKRSPPDIIVELYSATSTENKHLLDKLDTILNGFSKELNNALARA